MAYTKLEVEDNAVIYHVTVDNKNIEDSVCTCELCKKGDLIGVKGRIQSSVTIDDGTTYQETRKRELIIVAEKVTFLASRKEE